MTIVFCKDVRPVRQRWTKRWKIRGPKFIDPKQLQNPGILRPLHVLLISSMKSGEAAFATWACRIPLHLNVLDVRGDGLQTWPSESLGLVNQITNLVARLWREMIVLVQKIVSMAKIVVFSCIDIYFSWVVRPLSSVGCTLYIALSLLSPRL